MRFEHTVVVPLSLSDARKLLDELERRVPVLPGLIVRVELAVVDARSTSVQLRGELPGVSGLGSTLLLDTGMRLLRRYADQVVVAARNRSAEAMHRHAPARPAADGFTRPPRAGESSRRGSGMGDSATGQEGPSRPRDSYTFGNAPAGSGEIKRLRDEPMVWALGAVGAVLVLRSLRRRR